MLSIKELSDIYLLISFAQREPVKECTACCSMCEYLDICQMYADAYNELLKVGEYH